MEAIWQGLVNFAGRWVKFLGWLVTTIVIPVTAWFVLLKSDVRAMQRDVTDLKIETVSIKTGISNDKDKLNEKFEKILEKLGNIEGQLKRIR